MNVEDVKIPELVRRWMPHNKTMHRLIDFNELPHVQLTPHFYINSQLPLLGIV